MKKNIYILLFLPFASFVVGYLVSHFVFQGTVLLVPSIIGKPLQEAVELLSKNRLGLRLRVRQEDISLPEGIILHQLPQAGHKIRPNQSVFVTISARPKQFKMIDGWAKRKQDITTFIKDRGLDVNNVYLASHYPDGMCIGQCPLPEKQLDDKKVMFYFSDGKATIYVVPDFRGHIVEEVISVLNSDNVEIDTFHREHVDDDHQCSDCTIIAQYPLPGEIVDLNKILHVQLQVEQS